jgi:hypothetical protein
MVFGESYSIFLIKTDVLLVLPDGNIMTSLWKPLVSLSRTGEYKIALIPVYVL